MYRAVGVQKKFLRSIRTSLMTYPDTKSKNNPTDKAINGFTQTYTELGHNLRDSYSDSTEDPTGEKGKKDNAKKSNHLLPFGPIERVIDIVRRLWNKNDICTFLIFILMSHYLLGIRKYII